MGLLIDGKWSTAWYDTKSTDGKFVRQAAKFRNWVTKDGSAGPTGKGGFQAQSGRYHLYVSYACPWAHRTLIFRQLKDLTSHISVNVVHPLMLDDGWTFETDFDGATGDGLFNKSFLRDVYLSADPQASTRVTVPILWDKEQDQIVSNESSEIIRMFNEAFNDITGNEDDYYPASLCEQIDELNSWIYSDINNGVYRSGFATTQNAYEEAVTKLFAALDRVENILASSRYLTGDRITEADWRLWTTLLRFDPVYVGHFKTNIRRLVDYPNIWNYTRELYQWPGVASTSRLDHIKFHYYASHRTINPAGVVPIGPKIDFTAPHHRDTQ